MSLSYRLSGGQNNSNPNGSLGGQRSDTVITSGVLQNLFDNIPRTESLVGRTEFRCIYVYNTTGSGNLTGAVIEITINPSITMMSVGLDPAGKGDGRNNGIATTISSEDQVPTGVKFFGEENTDDELYNTVKLPVGLLKEGEGIALWFKRKTEKGSAQNISVTVTLTHDSVTLPGETVDDGAAIGELIAVTTQNKDTFAIGSARVDFSEVAANP